MKKLLFAVAAVSTLGTASAATFPTNTTPPWKSYMATGNTADIVSSPTVAAAIGGKVDATSGQSLNQTLQTPSIAGGTATNIILSGGTETKEPTDVPGSTGTSIPNTFWVDSYYIPRSKFISTDTTWTVCASGCKYTSPLTAWNDAVNANYGDGAILTISISDGTYNLDNQFFTNTTNTQHVHIIGNTTTPSNVKLNFTNGKGTNLNGFDATGGGIIGLIDGVTIQQPSDGTGALSSVDSSGRFIWNSNSYGAGVQAYGAGSNINLGSHVDIYWFYYSVVADNNAGVDAPSGGVSGNDAGDVNFMARGGGVIVCTPCTAVSASDYTSPSTTTLGSNFDAERGGSLYIDGSTGKWGLVNGVVGITGGSIWAHNITLSGGLNSEGSAITMWEGAHGEFSGCSVSGAYTAGVTSASSSFANVNSCTITGNTTGIVADGGRVEGSSVTITNNTTYGIQALHQGSVVLYDTYSRMSGNGTNFNVQAAGTETTSGSSYTASSIDVQ